MKIYRGRLIGTDPAAPRLAVLAIVLLAASLGASAFAQISGESLPNAEQILDRYVDAIGGLATLEKIRNLVIRTTTEIAGAGVKLSTTVYQARPNRSYTVLESPATGKIESGTDGEIAWTISALSGPQVLEGKERATQLHVNTFDRLVYWRKVFKQVETAGVENVNGKACYKVVFTPFDLPPQTVLFDRETYLPAKMVMMIESRAGAVAAESYLSDFRAVDGILLAHKTVVHIMGQQRITTIDGVEHNVDLPADRFALPKEIKLLLKKSPGKPQEWLQGRSPFRLIEAVCRIRYPHPMIKVTMPPRPGFGEGLCPWLT